MESYTKDLERQVYRAKKKTQHKTWSESKYAELLDIKIAGKNTGPETLLHDLT